MCMPGILEASETKQFPLFRQSLKETSKMAFTISFLPGQLFLCIKNCFTLRLREVNNKVLLSQTFLKYKQAKIGFSSKNSYVRSLAFPTNIEQAFQLYLLRNQASYASIKTFTFSFPSVPRLPGTSLIFSDNYC